MTCVIIPISDLSSTFLACKGKGAARRNSRHSHLMTKQAKPLTYWRVLGLPRQWRRESNINKKCWDYWWMKIKNFESKQTFLCVSISCTHLFLILLRICFFEVIFPFHFIKDELSSTGRAKNSSKHPWKLEGQMTPLHPHKLTKLITAAQNGISIISNTK